MLLYLLRVLLIFIPACLMEFMMMKQCFSHPKPIAPLVILGMIRIVLISPLYLPQALKTSDIELFCSVTQLILTPLQNLMFVHTFYNRTTPPGKILAIGLVCEGIGSLCISITTLIVNSIEGYGFTVASFAVPFQPLDFLIPIIIMTIYSLIIVKAQRFFVLIRNYQLKYPTAVFLAVLPVYIVAVINSAAPLSFGFTVYYVMIASIIIMFMIALYAYVSSINIQRKTLRASSQMVNDHYQMLQSRIDELQRQQNEINAKMTVLVSANFPEDLTKRYLNDMKYLKDNLYTTLYTHYYMIDAVLSAKAKDYREHNVNFACQCEGLALKHLSQVQVSQVLMTLFRYIDQYDNTSVNVKLSSYKNQVIIVLETTDNIGISGLKRQITNQLSNKLLSIQKRKQTLYLSFTD